MSTIKLAAFRNFRRLFSDIGTSKRWRVMGIETSCDDTGVAIVDSDKNIIAEKLHSQADIHAMHGGILPVVAGRLHQRNIKNVVQETLEMSNLGIKDLDAIAVTVKPGNLMSLHAGIEYAKDLCTLYTKPLIPIHHMEAHALTIRILEDIEFPFLVLLVSGGHCILAIAESVTKFSVLIETEDFSPGLLFDKIARRLNLKDIDGNTLLPGGVCIERVASMGSPFNIELALFDGMKSSSFIFSGALTKLDSYILAEARKYGIETHQVLPNVADICASFQFQVFKYICNKVEIGFRYVETKKLIENEKMVLVVSGGVASNEYLRKMLQHVCNHYNCKLMFPPKNLCTDNGVMIAWNGIERIKANVPMIPPNEFQSVKESKSCSLGDVLSEDLKMYRRLGKYVKLDKIMRKEMKNDINLTQSANLNLLEQTS